MIEALHFIDSPEILLMSSAFLLFGLSVQQRLVFWLPCLLFPPCATKSEDRWEMMAANSSGTLARTRANRHGCPTPLFKGFVSFTYFQVTASVSFTTGCGPMTKNKQQQRAATNLVSQAQELNIVIDHPVINMSNQWSKKNHSDKRVQASTSKYVLQMTILVAQASIWYWRVCCPLDPLGWESWSWQNVFFPGAKDGTCPTNPAPRCLHRTTLQSSRIQEPKDLWNSGTLQGPQHPPANQLHLATGWNHKGQHSGGSQSFNHQVKTHTNQSQERCWQSRCTKHHPTHGRCKDRKTASFLNKEVRRQVRRS